MGKANRRRSPRNPPIGGIPGPQSIVPVYGPSFPLGFRAPLCPGHIRVAREASLRSYPGLRLGRGSWGHLPWYGFHIVAFHPAGFAAPVVVGIISLPLGGHGCFGRWPVGQRERTWSGRAGFAGVVACDLADGKAADLAPSQVRPDRVRAGGGRAGPGCNPTGNAGPGGGGLRPGVRLGSVDLSHLLGS